MMTTMLLCQSMLHDVTVSRWRKRRRLVELYEWWLVPRARLIDRLYRLTNCQTIVQYPTCHFCLLIFYLQIFCLLFFSAFWFICHLIFCLLNSACWLSAFWFSALHNLSTPRTMLLMLLKAVCPSVRLSHRYSVETAKHIIKVFDRRI